MVITIGKNF